MDMPYLTGKGDETPILKFYLKNSLFYNLIAVIYDKKFFTRPRRSM